jgi:RimJ/RimL family protein N-acetyltransferase
MPKEIIYSYPEVHKFVKDFFPLTYSLSAAGIGIKQDGKIIAGVIYDDFNGSNIWAHIAANPGKRWVNKALLYTCFAYPFIQLQCNRITGWVESSNFQSRRFCEHLGFVTEATLKSAARDGGDVIIYVMRRENCKHI